MKNIIGIRREDLSKTGEKRVAIVPDQVQSLAKSGSSILVQPGIHPLTGENKRAFADEAYVKAGAKVTENIAEARVIFGLKEIGAEYLEENKTYLFFSHTHKGQVKNRAMLAELKRKKCTVLDYELVVDEKGSRIITAFTYMAGRAGMIDSLWTLGKRLDREGITNPFSRIPQSIEKEDLGQIKDLVKEAADDIRRNGTPAQLPPMIVCFLGDGKTSIGAQEIFDLLPVKEIKLSELKDICQSGSRNFVYKLVLNITTMFRLKEEAGALRAVYSVWPAEEKRSLYFRQPELFESALDQVLPWTTLVMNCIIWAPKYPRVVTCDNTLAAAKTGSPLRVIGDISCDPNGGVEYSKETWIDNPVYIYHPETRHINDGFEGEGIAVMAVANLPCEFSSDASAQFSNDLKPLLDSIAHADYDRNIDASGLLPPLRESCILWQGEFTEKYKYMEQYLTRNTV